MPAGLTLFTETWPGANTAAWPDVASSAHSVGTVIETDTNHGRIRTTGSALAGYLDYGVALYDMGTNTNYEIAGEYQWGAVTEAYMDIGFRRSTGVNTGAGDCPADGYTLQINSSAATNCWYLQKNTASSQVTVATGTALTQAISTAYAFRVRCIGQSIRCKVWAGTLTSGEPATWGIDWVDDNWPEVIATAHYASLGCLGGSAQGMNMWYDNVTIQAFAEPVLSLIGSSNSVTTGTTQAVVLAGNAYPQIGDVIIVCGARDNVNNDPATGDTAADASGNTYTRPAAFCSPTGASTAAAGQVGVMLQSKLTTAWDSTHKTVTWTFPSIASRAMTVLWIGATTGYRSTSAGSAGGASGTAAATTGFGVGVPVVDDIVVGMTAFENSGTQTETADTDTVNGSWSAVPTRSFSGSSATAVTALTFSKVITQWKRLTAGGSQTYNTTNSVTSTVDTVSIVAAFAGNPTYAPPQPRSGLPLALLAR